MANRKTIHVWFDEYSEYHTNPTNKMIHWICIPLITFSLLGLLWEIPLPTKLAALSPWLNSATIFTAASLVFYLRLSPSIAVGMLIVAGSMLAIISFGDIKSHGLVWKASLAIFVVAWIGQFVGHRIEGRKPAFVEDLQFLLIGPAWLLGFIYRKFRISY